MPLLWLSLAFLTGILTARILHLPSTSWALLAGAAFILFLTRLGLKRAGFHPQILKRFKLPFSGRNPPLPVSLLLAALALGAARYQSTIPDLRDPAFIGFYNDRQVQMMVTGVIEALPDVRDRGTTLRVRVERMHPAGDLHYQEVRGLVLVTTSPEKDFHYGDRVVVRGILETPAAAEAFSYREYLARQGIYTNMRNATVSRLESGQGKWWMGAIYGVKEKALARVYQLWPDPEASLFAGILLGVESNISAPVKQAFQETGTSHIIAISGFNIAIVAGLFTRSFGRILGPYKGGAVALAAIAVYTLLVGADPAVVRAAIMGGLALGAGLIGRRQTGVYTLVITAGGMAIGWPQVLWDVGFQLSFAATLGLVLYADSLGEGFIRLVSRWIPEERAVKLAGPVGEYFLFTFAAQITTLPLMAYYFGTISWIAFAANPVILPVQPPIMVLGGMALLLGLAWLPLGRLAAPLAWPFVGFTIRAVEFFGRHPRGALPLGDFSAVWLAFFYLLLFGLTGGWPRIRVWLETHKDDFREEAVIPLAAVLGLAAVLVWRAALTAPDGRLHLTLLEVGSGDAILVETPEGRYLLINGGPSASLLSDGLGRRLPLFQRQLDWLVVAAPRSEQIGGLARSLERFPPREVLWAGLPSPCRQADYLREVLSGEQIPVMAAEKGQVFDLGKGATLEVVAAGPRGAVLLLAWEHFRALLPLGLSAGDFESLRMGKEIGRVSVLLLADNGYGPLTPQAWVANLNPRLFLLSVAADDPNGLPDRETLEALTSAPLLRTDEHGWVEISTDGQQMWVEVEK